MLPGGNVKSTQVLTRNRMPFDGVFSLNDISARVQWTFVAHKLFDIWFMQTHTQSELRITLDLWATKETDSQNMKNWTYLAQPFHFSCHSQDANDIQIQNDLKDGEEPDWLLQNGSWICSIPNNPQAGRIGRVPHKWVSRVKASSIVYFIELQWKGSV